MEINKKLLLVGLFGWLLAGAVTLFNWQAVYSKGCFFINYWPFCGIEENPQNYLSGIFVAIIFSFLVFSGFYFWKIIFNKTEITKNFLIAIPIVFIFFSIILLPFTSSDVSYYFSAGKAAADGLNPYTENWKIENGFLRQSLSSAVSGFMYGPLSLQLFKIFYNFSNGNVISFVFYWKLFMAVVFMLVGILVYSLVRREGGETDKKMFYIFFLSQPLFLWEWIGNGHFDGLWLIFLLLAFILAYLDKWWFVLISLTIGIWIKFIPVFALPWFVLWWWQGVDKNNWTKKFLEIVCGIAASLAITYFSWIHLWQGAETLKPILLQSKWAVQSIFAIVYYSLRPLFVFVFENNAHYILTRLVHLLLLLLVVYFIWPYLKNIYLIILKKIKWSEIKYLNAIFVSLLIYLLVWQKSLWPWYLTWLTPIGLIVYFKSNNKYLKNILIWISLAPLFFYVPWMMAEGNPEPANLWFFSYSILLIVAYPLFELFKWRKSGYELK